MVIDFSGEQKWSLTVVILILGVLPHGKRIGSELKITLWRKMVLESVFAFSVTLRNFPDLKINPFLSREEHHAAVRLAFMNILLVYF